MSRHAKKFPTCLNCDYPLDDAYAYCPSCGQENHDLHIPVKHLFVELVEGVLHFDAKFFQTAKLLLFKPGTLTQEYNAGRRTKFVPPVRMYIFISFIFFLLLSMHYRTRNENVQHQKTKEGKDSVAAGIVNASRVHPVVADSIDTVIGAGPAGLRLKIGAQNKSDSTGGGYIINKVRKLEADGFHGFVAAMFKSMSYMMFLLMPFAGFLVSVAYRSHDRYYIDHLVFTVHFHCFAFLLFSTYFIAAEIIPYDPLAWSVPIILLGYLFLALKRVYKEKTSRTILKSFLITSGYGIVLIFAFLISILISVVII